MPNLEHGVVPILVADIVPLVNCATLEFSTGRSNGQVVILLHADVEHPAEMRCFPPRTSLLFNCTLFTRMSLIPTSHASARTQTIPLLLESSLRLHVLTPFSLIDGSGSARVETPSWVVVAFTVPLNIMRNWHCNINRRM